MTENNHAPERELPNHGIYVLQTRRGLHPVASIPPPASELTTSIWTLFRPAVVRDVLEGLGADADVFLAQFASEDFFTDDELFETPGGIAFAVSGGDPERLQQLLYREPSGPDRGGWLYHGWGSRPRPAGFIRIAIQARFDSHFN